MVIPEKIPQEAQAKLIASVLQSEGSGQPLSLDDPEINDLQDTGLYIEGLTECGLIPEVYDRRAVQEQIGKWVDGFNDYIYWLAMRFTSLGEKYEVEPLLPLVEQNLALSKDYFGIRKLFIKDDVAQRGISAAALRGHLCSVLKAIRTVECGRGA